MNTLKDNTLGDLPYTQGRLKHTMGPGQKKRMGPIVIE